MVEYPIALAEQGSILNLPVCRKRCPDYDEDCPQMTTCEARLCWAGNPTFIENKGVWVYAGQAKGYCPLIHI